MSAEVAEGIQLAYQAFDREEQVLWDRYAESRLYWPDGRNYIRGTEVARRELRRRITAELYFARQERSGEAA